MKRFVLLSLACALLASAFVSLTRANANSPSTTFTIDKVHSTIVFRIIHLDAGPFWGRFNQPEGSFTFDGDDLTMDVTIRIANVDTANKMRDDHLRSADYFNAEEFPRATFKSKSASKTGENTWNVTGDLTIRGTTRPVSLVMTKVGESHNPDPQIGHRVGIEGELPLKRSEFGIGQPEGLGDDVRMIVALEGRE